MLSFSRMKIINEIFRQYFSITADTKLRLGNHIPIIFCSLRNINNLPQCASMGNNNISLAGICFSQRIRFFLCDKTESVFSQFESFQIASI